MELTRGDVLVNFKSTKEYAVVYTGTQFLGGGDAEAVNYVGLRNGKSFGPIRSGSRATIIKNFGKTAKTAIFSGPRGWSVVSVEGLRCGVTVNLPIGPHACTETVPCSIHYTNRHPFSTKGAK
jgi:hypothetical protein